MSSFEPNKRHLREGEFDVEDKEHSGGKFPENWIHALITFLPKQGGKGVRPISLLSYLFKVMKKNYILENEMVCRIKKPCSPIINLVFVL
ncbi:hypothetical protein ALC53_12812 [Atta colombica]|uniref:Uncharacterized protein n=1 Tax=Atta colombica TaxID=520822 RepID=A0A151HZ35_9HYME|nr:hypothetical protein ALC53_12812 [Atta colombica]